MPSLITVKRGTIFLKAKKAKKILAAMFIGCTNGAAKVCPVKASLSREAEVAGATFGGYEVLCIAFF